MSSNSYAAVGMMSGTSLDGLDIAYCVFTEKNGAWSFSLETSETIRYEAYWKNKLVAARAFDNTQIEDIHREFGAYLGEQASLFIRKKSISPQFLASHGHTIFHEPEKGITVQIGDAKSIHDYVKIPVINDFRTVDVSLGGQGAPLVPIGDRLLFSEYDYCLNLGGFVNVSMEHRGSRIAMDICPMNTLMNYFANQLGFEFDKGGQMAEEGNIIDDLLHQLNSLSYYSQEGPKSLGQEWIDSEVYPLIKNDWNTKDILRTLVEHAVVQIEKVILKYGDKGKMLVTGGGAFNTFFINQLSNRLNLLIVRPDDRIIEFKEAIIFAFLGVLKWRNEVNTLCSVTGASRDSTGGTIYPLINSQNE